MYYLWLEEHNNVFLNISDNIIVGKCTNSETLRKDETMSRRIMPIVLAFVAVLTFTLIPAFAETQTTEQPQGKTTIILSKKSIPFLFFLLPQCFLKALQVCVIPFLLGDAIKIATATALSYVLRPIYLKTHPKGKVETEEKE